MMTAVALLAILVGLCFLAIGHQHNEIQALRRRMNAAHLTIQVFADKVAALSRASKR